MNPRIAVGSLFQESNSFAAGHAEIDDFEALVLADGPEAAELAGSPSEVGALLATLAERGAEVVPLVIARAASGPVLSSSCYAQLRARLLQRLRAADTLDGVALSLHGAMMVEGLEDPEGDLLASVRALVGPCCPIVATLDMHAHVTPAMLETTQALVPYHHYPHDDTFETGERAAHLLADLVGGAPWPGMTLVKVPVLSPGANAHTRGDGPLARVSEAARAAAAEHGLLDVSLLHVHPHIDVPDMGLGVLALGHGGGEREAVAEALARELWAERFALEGVATSVGDAVAASRRVPGTAVLVDWADCVGGGAAGDGVHVLRELLRLDVPERVQLPLVDPPAALACVAAGSGAELELELGHTIDPRWGEPVHVRGIVERTLPDASFRYGGGIYGGGTASMGATAVLRVGREIRVLVSARGTYEWGDEQFQTAGLDAREADLVVAKNPGNYLRAYAGVASVFLPVDGPGPTTPRLETLPYRRITRPCFPFDGRAADAPPPRMMRLATPGDGAGTLTAKETA